jgi:anti-sigma B factor antagonist
VDIKQVNVNEIVILELEGRLDTLSSTKLENKLSDLIAEKKGKLVLDFSQLDFISSSGLRVLLAAGKKLKSFSGKIVLCSLKDHVKEVFDVAGFTVLFSLQPTREAALQEVK